MKATVQRYLNVFGNAVLAALMVAWGVFALLMYVVVLVTLIAHVA